MPPKKTPSHSEPILPPGRFIRAPMSKAKIPPKACRIRPPDSGPPPPQSLFDLMLPLLIEDNPLNAVAGPLSQVCG
jgi:hypothetical protein